MDTRSHVVFEEVFSWSPDIVEEPSAFFDELHQAVLLFSRGEKSSHAFLAPHIMADEQLAALNFTNLEFIPSEVMDARLSPDMDHMLIQLAPKSFRLNSSTEFVDRKSKSSASIRGMHWLWDVPLADFFLLTTSGLELYRIVRAKNKLSFKVAKTHKFSAVGYWYNPNHKFVLLVDCKATLQGYRFGDKSTKLNKFSLPELHESAMIDAGDFRRQIRLVDISGKLHMTFCDERKGELRVFEITDLEIIELFQLNLFSSGVFKISEIDNLLVVHSMSTKIPIIFDVYSSSDPVVAPLPLSLKEDEKESHLTAYDERWQLVLPNILFLPSKGERFGSLYILHLNLNFIVETWGNRTDALMQFLAERTGSTKILIRVMKSVIVKETQRSLFMMDKMFQTMCRACRVDDGDEKIGVEDEAKVMSLIQPNQMTSEVLEPCYGKVAATHLLRMSFNYLRALYISDIYVPEDLVTLIFDLIVETNELQSLQQLQQYQILPDSQRFAESLLSLSQDFAPATQLAYDMLHRLGNFESLKDDLLDRGEVIKALKLLIHHSLEIKPEEFLERCDERSQFVAIFQLLENQLDGDKHAEYYERMQLI